MQEPLGQEPKTEHQQNLPTTNQSWWRLNREKLNVSIGVPLLIVLLTTSWLIWHKYYLKPSETAISNKLSNKLSEVATPNDTNTTSTSEIKILNPTVIDIAGKITMHLPMKWKLIEQTDKQAVIQTDYKPYDVKLIMDYAVNKPNEIQDYKVDRSGFDYTKIAHGEIFKVACGGGSGCFGAIVNGDVYTFDFDIQSNQPAPANLDEIWVPDNNLEESDLWNLLLTITSNAI